MGVSLPPSTHDDTRCGPAAAKGQLMGQLADRPRATRYDMSAPLMYRCLGEDPWRRGRTENISRSGVLFQAAVPVPAASTRIEFIVKLPDLEPPGGSWVQCRGHVVRHCRAAAAGRLRDGRDDRCLRLPRGRAGRAARERESREPGVNLVDGAATSIASESGRYGHRPQALIHPGRTTWHHEPSHLRFDHPRPGRAASFVGGSMWARRGSPTASSAQQKALYYTCPMHPQYTSDRPGDCPICGMRLEPVAAGGASGKSSRRVSTLPGWSSSAPRGNS